MTEKKITVYYFKPYNMIVLGYYEDGDLYLSRDCDEKYVKQSWLAQGHFNTGSEVVGIL